jgi:hypothetical protein
VGSTEKDLPAEKVDVAGEMDSVLLAVASSGAERVAPVSECVAEGEELKVRVAINVLEKLAVSVTVPDNVGGGNVSVLADAVRMLTLSVGVGVGVAAFVCELSMVIDGEGRVML